MENIQEKQKNQENEAKTLFSQKIDKMNKDGTRMVGSYLVETKIFNDVPFVMVTQQKFAFGNQPAKKSWITFNPKDEDLLSALQTSVKAGENIE